MLSESWQPLTASGVGIPSRTASHFGALSMITPSSMVHSFSSHIGELFTTVCLLAGTTTIARFAIFEYRLVRSKAEAVAGIQKTKGSAFSVMEMFQYRIDYHFSKSKWAKVYLLLSFTFMLIAVGAPQGKDKRE